jgi:hypothetical protein
MFEIKAKVLWKTSHSFFLCTFRAVQFAIYKICNIVIITYALERCSDMHDAPLCSIKTTQKKARAVDPHSLNPDPDPDTDPTFQVNPDPDPIRIQGF